MKQRDFSAMLSRHGTPMTMSPETKDRILAVLLDEARRVTFAVDERWKTQKPSFFIFHPSRMIITIIAVVLLTGSIGTAVAANGARPGDVLYPVDRAIESVRLKVAPAGEARARLITEFAAERQDELKSLEQKSGREDRVAKAQQLADDALAQALGTVDEVRDKMGEDGLASDRARDALGKIEDRLAEVQKKHREQIDDALKGLGKVEVKISATSSRVKTEFAGVKSEFTLPITDLTVIIREIASRLDISESAVRAVIHVERERSTRRNPSANTNSPINVNRSEDDDDRNANENKNVNRPRNKNRDIDDRDEEDENRNENENRNASRNQNTNSSNSNVNSVESESWKIEVRVRDGKAEIKTEHGRDKQEWSVLANDQTAILSSIGQRTGLTTVFITGVWEYKND
ncbi:MAG: hypothetical protein HY566_02175 [Candidatus Kerfeldbacteria bacterium]|nr:hypothetical protein [Candidatus Kerfeldbacteria bacterium]